MPNVTIKMLDGTRKDFIERGRPGGSYSMRVRYEPGVVIVIDEYDKETATPLELVREVVVDELRRGW